MSNKEINTESPFLLVEDNPDDVLITKRAWKKGSIRNKLFHVENGEEALKFLNKEGKYTDAPRPILVLLDLKLPKVDGFEVLRVVKQDDNLKDIPIIVLTTSERDSDVERAFKLGCNTYLVKPVHFDSFLKTLLKVEEFWLTISTLPKMRS